MMKDLKDITKGERLKSEMKDSDLNLSEKLNSSSDSKYWMHLDQWKDDSQFAKLAKQEFTSTPLDSKEEGGWARREFLKLMGASLALGTFSCVRRPAQKIVPYVDRPPEVVPGRRTEYASTFQDGQEEVGIVVVTRQGRPVKVEGNKLHPINSGGMSARAHSHILTLYDPDRLQGPKKNLFNKKKSNFDTLSTDWKKADKEIIENLKNEGVALLTPTILSPSTRSLLEEFKKTFKVDHFVWESVTFENIREAEKLCYGQSLFPRLRLDQASFVLSIGTDFLGTHTSALGGMKDYAKRRHPDSKMNRLVVFESLLSLTGANADLRFRIEPSEQWDVLMELIYQLVFVKKRSRYASLPSFLDLLQDYKREKNSILSQQSSEEKEAQKNAWESIDFPRLAEDLWKHRGQSLVVAGGMETKTKDALSLQIAANFLNHILENDGKTLDHEFSPYESHKGRSDEIQRLIQNIDDGKIKTLMIHGINPGYILGKRQSFMNAMTKVNQVIYTGDRIDETGILSDYILPDHHPMENWNDVEFQRGIFGIQQPTIRPLYDTRSFQDSLLIWIKSENPSKVKASSWYGYFQNQWKKRRSAYRFADTSPQTTLSFEEFWTSLLKKGVFDTLKVKRNSFSRVRPFRIQALLERIKEKKIQQRKSSLSSSHPFELILYKTIGLSDGSMSNVSWLQEFPDPVTKICWDNYLCVSPFTARKWNFKEGEVVELSVKDGEETKRRHVPIHIQPGQSDKSLGLAVGYGHWKAGKVSNKVGVEAFSLSSMGLFESSKSSTKSQTESFVRSSKALSLKGKGEVIFSGIPSSLKKTNQFVPLAQVQGHHSMEGRQIVVESTLKELMQNPSANIHRHKTFSLWNDHEYPGHKWAMAVDLNTCTGCSACVIACQSENNIPTVGKKYVLEGRQMHWIRIDRYYNGHPTDPYTVFMPVTCQHCDNAPCETVCPVVATVHGKEGTNDMIYNRCVGTRYCMNNCPYKVRRFNWFNYANVESPLHWALNPDVTVRSRGVMEKCTFCIHRIHQAKHKAFQEGRKKGKGGRILKEGEIKTACQESCPTEAIAFGDVNDPKSKVSQWFKEERSYALLEELNVKPAFRYKTKIRNKEKSHLNQDKSHHSNSSHSNSLSSKIRLPDPMSQSKPKDSH